MQHTAMTPGTGREPERGDDLIDLRGLIAALWRGRWILAGCLVLAIGAAAAWVVTAKPEYYASAVVMIEHDNDGVVDLRQMLNNRPLNEAVIQSHMRVIRSKRLLRDVVERLGLADDPAFNPAAAGPSPPGLQDRVMQAVRGLIAQLAGGAPDAAPSDAPPVSPDGTRRAVGALQRDLDVRQVGISYAIEIGFTADDPRTAARVANGIADSFIALQQADKIAASTDATRRLVDQIAELELDVRASQEAVESFRLSSGLGDENRREALGRQLDRLRESRSEARETMARLEEEITRAEQEDGGAGADRAGGALESGTARLAPLRAELAAARSRERSLAASIEEAEARVSRLVRAEARLQELERQATADRLIYERMLEELKEIDALENLQRADARVIDRAEPPLGPSGPSKKLALAMAIAGGGGLGLAILALTELLRSNFRTREELESFSSLPVVGSLPRVASASSPDRVLRRFASGREAELTEAVRELRLGALATRRERSGAVVAVSSARAGEGKSTFALLLARGAAALGHRAIVVDGDTRRSRLSSVLGLRKRHNLEHVLSGRTAWTDAVQVDKRHGLHVLGPWSRTADVPDAFARPEFGALVDQLADSYDLVVIDTPPLGPVADAKMLAGYADLLFMLVAWRSTHRGAVRDALERLGGADVPAVGLVLSKVDLRKEARFRAVPYDRYRTSLPPADNRRLALNLPGFARDAAARQNPERTRA